MNILRKTVHFLVLIALIWSMLSSSALDAKPQAAEAAGAGTSTPAGVEAAEWQSIQSQMRQAEYQITRRAAGSDDAQPTYWAPNRAHGWRLEFTAQGLELAPAEADGDWRWGLALVGVGYERLHAPQAEPQISVEAQHLSYHWSENLSEWYHNTPDGLEHGFSLAQRPSGYRAGQPLRLELAVLGGLTAHLADNGALVFRQGKQKRLRYDQLHVYDANGSEVPAWLELIGEAGLRIRIDDRTARYPLTIDPLLTSQGVKLSAADARSGDYFGSSVAISGDTLLVGADSKPTTWSDPLHYAGAAYVFERNQEEANTWSQVKKLTASDAQADDHFGYSVAISGDTLLVGTFSEGGEAAYVFERNLGGTNNWGEVKKLSDSNAPTYDQFGRSVAISGDTLLVGARSDNGETGNPIIDAGASYIFERNLGGADNWGQVKKLTASDAQAGDHFGYSVAISGDTLLVGAANERGGAGDPFAQAGAAYVFERNLGGADNWGEVKKLSASDADWGEYFGISVAISGDTLLVGTSGKSRGVGDPLYYAGSAYVFERNLGGVDNWGEVKKLTVSEAQTNDHFGISVAISGDTLLVGAPFEGGGAGDPLPTAGAAYVFERNHLGANYWGQVRKLTASDAEPGDYFGNSVAISGDTLLVGAPSENGGEGDPRTNSGATYVFEHTPPYPLYLPLIGK